jgi:hypothetical protein
MNPDTFALVLETNNLRGGGGSADRVADSLERLLANLREQTFPLTKLSELVVTHDGLDAPTRARLEAVAGRAIHFVELPEDTGYYAAKNLGFDATTADVVAFGDADCWPDWQWLEQLFAPFCRGAAVVAGRTSYRDDMLGAAATAIDFMYFASPLGADCTRNFYANNVAFRREVFAAHPYPVAAKIYRGHCQRLGMSLLAAGVPIEFVHRAHTVHRFPDSAAELLRLRLLRGADTVEMSPHIADALLPPRWQWLGRLGPLSALGVLAGRFACSSYAVGRQGCQPIRGVRRAACVGAVAAFSGADALGALGRSVLRRDFGVRNGSLVTGALSYHGGRERLSNRES